MTSTLSPKNKTIKTDHQLEGYTATGKQSPALGTRFRAVILMLLITVLLLGVIGGRLGYLQLVQGEQNRELAQQRRIRILPQPPVRGNILDRNGEILADTRLSYSAYVWPSAQQKPNWDQTRDRLSEILNISSEAITEQVEQFSKNNENSLKSFRIARGLTPEQVTAIEEYSHQLSGVALSAEPIRNYPHGKVAAHVLGYTGAINEKERKEQDNDYRRNDVIGRRGVEAAFEDRLRGKWGEQQVKVNIQQQIVQILGEKEAKSGQKVTLTLDLELQKAAEAVLGQQKGAIVALNPNNGEVLAMASQPSFDPNLFSSGISSEKWKQLNSESNNKPLLNRALRNFPPASTFKIVTATAGLESGEYPPHTRLNTYPFLKVSGVRIWEWNRAGFGRLGYVGALANSSNTFFGQIGRGVGKDVLIDWARQYGFGEETEIELPNEGSGLVPTPEWKEKHDYPSWSVADTVNLSLGQGLMLSTPLQVALMFAVPANGGYQLEPHLLKTETDDSQWKTSMNLNPSTLKVLRKGLRQVVTRGTGTALNVPNLPAAAGKTGTAELPEKKTSHAWFGGYAPYDDPEIVVVAFAENSYGGGGSVAAPMVRQVMQAYFEPN